MATNKYGDFDPEKITTTNYGDFNPEEIKPKVEIQKSNTTDYGDFDPEKITTTKSTFTPESVETTDYGDFDPSLVTTSKYGDFNPSSVTTSKYGDFNPEDIVVTSGEVKLREFQKQWREDHPVKVEYGSNDYTPVSYYGGGVSKSIGLDLEEWKPMPYQSLEVENKEFKGVVNNILGNYLQRGNWAAANVADRILQGDYGDAFSAAWKGLSGQEQRYFSDVMKGAGSDNVEAEVLGFILDVGLDPLNYVPLGKAIRAAKKGITKTDLFKEMANTGLVKNLQKMFSAGQGMPKELYKFIKYRGRDLDAKQWKVIEKTKKLFNATTPESREMMSRIRAGKLPLEKLTTKQNKVFDIIVNDLRKIGREAVDVKLISKDAYLKNIDDYIHGFYRGRTKLGGVWGRGGKAAFRKPKVWNSPVEQYDWATNLKKSMEKVTDLTEARKLAVDAGFVEDASALTLKEIKSGVKNIKLAEMDFLKSSALREVEQIREVGRITMVNEATRKFGKPLPKGLKALPDDTAVYIPRGTVPDLFLKESDDVAQGIKALLGNIKTDLVEISPDIAEKLAARRGAPKAFMLPKEIAHHLNLVGDYLTPGGEELNLVFKAFDKVQGLWKGLVTAVRPAFHMRNATSNMFLAWLSGIPGVDLLPRHAESIKMMKRSANTVLTNNFGRVKYSKIEDLVKQVGAAGRGWMGAAEPHKIWNALDDIFTPKVTWGKAKKAISPIELGRKFGQVIEDTSRRAVFIDEIIKSNKATLGEAAVDAAERVAKFLYDYDELSLFEKKWMKRAVPFYTWMRKNIPNMFNQLLEQPDKFAKIGKIKRVTGIEETPEEKALKPEWMEEMGFQKSPVKDKAGNSYYYYMDLPTKDLGTLFNLSEVYSSLTPAKEVVHLALNVKAFPTMGERIAPEGSEYADAPAWMAFLPEKAKKALNLGEGYDRTSGKRTIKIHKKVLYAMETFMPPVKDLNSASNMIFPQPVEYLRNKALHKAYSNVTGMQIRALDLTWEKQNISFELNNEIKKLNALVNQRPYDYMDSKEYAKINRRINELDNKLNIK